MYSQYFHPRCCHNVLNRILCNRQVRTLAERKAANPLDDTLKMLKEALKKKSNTTEIDSINKKKVQITDKGNNDIVKANSNKIASTQGSKKISSPAKKSATQSILNASVSTPSISPVETEQPRIRIHTHTIAGENEAVGDAIDKDSEPKSKRQIFREIPLDFQLLNHLDSIKLGYLPSRRSRVEVAKKIKRNEIEVSSSLRPRNVKFVRRPGKIDVEPKKAFKITSMTEVRRFCADTPFPFRAPAKFLSKADVGSAVGIHDSLHRTAAEVAIIGRSNVGKSTLLNSLAAFDQSYVQKSDISDKPGHTKHLAFYGLGQVADPNPPVDTKSKGAKNPNAPSPKMNALVLVDMPGYGFAYMSEAEKARCEKLSTDYLTGQVSPRTGKPLRDKKILKRVILLLDGRHGIKKADVDFFLQLKEAFDKLDKPNDKGSAAKGSSSSSSSSSSASSKGVKTKRSWKLQVVLTKCDLVERKDLCRRMRVMMDTFYEQLSGFFDVDLPIIPLSGMERKGVVNLQQQLASMVPAKPKDSEEDSNEESTASQSPSSDLTLSSGSDKETERVVSDYSIKKPIGSKKSFLERGKKPFLAKSPDLKRVASSFLRRGADKGGDRRGRGIEYDGHRSRDRQASSRVSDRDRDRPRMTTKGRDYDDRDRGRDRDRDSSSKRSGGKVRQVAESDDFWGDEDDDDDEALSRSSRQKDSKGRGKVGNSWAHDEDDWETDDDDHDHSSSSSPRFGKSKADSSSDRKPNRFSGSRTKDSNNSDSRPPSRARRDSDSDSDSSDHRGRGKGRSAKSVDEFEDDGEDTWMNNLIPANYEKVVDNDDDDYDDGDSGEERNYIPVRRRKLPPTRSAKGGGTKKNAKGGRSTKYKR